MRYHLLSTFVLLACLSIASAQDAQKLSVPDDASQKQAISLIANLYKADYDAAKTSEDKSALAKKMLQVGIDSKDDAIGRYVLFRLSRDIAAGAGDSTTAMEAIDLTASSYDVDAIALKADMLARVVKALKLPKEHQDLAETLTATFNAAIAQDRFDLAKQINETALASARQARSTELVKTVVTQGKEVEELEVEFAKVKEALATLKTSPTDPDANLIVGQYQCLVKGDWDNGVLMLALGSDEKLKAIAEAELADEKDPLLLGNSWWEYGESLDGRAQLRVRQRAAAWYAKAKPEGLSKKVVESRLAILTNEDSELPEKNTPQKETLVILANKDWKFTLVSDSGRYDVIKGTGTWPAVRDGAKFTWTENGTTYTIDLDNRAVIRSRNGQFLSRAPITSIDKEDESK